MERMDEVARADIQGMDGDDLAQYNNPDRLCSLYGMTVLSSNKEGEVRQVIASHLTKYYKDDDLQLGTSGSEVIFIMYYSLHAAKGRLADPIYFHGTTGGGVRSTQTRRNQDADFVRLRIEHQQTFSMLDARPFKSANADDVGGFKRIQAFRTWSKARRQLSLRCARRQLRVQNYDAKCLQRGQPRCL